MTLHDMEIVFPEFTFCEVWELRRTGSKEYFDGHGEMHPNMAEIGTEFLLDNFIFAEGGRELLSNIIGRLVSEDEYNEAEYRYFNR